jgi:hypothetical protein
MGKLHNLGPKGCWETEHGQSWDHDVWWIASLFDHNSLPRFSHQFGDPCGIHWWFPWDNFFFPLHSGFLCLRMWRVWGTTNFAAHLLVNKPRTYRGKTLYIKSPGETQKKSWTRGPNIHNQNLLCSAFSTNKILNNMYRIAYWVMWDRAPYLVNIEVRGAPRQILGKTWLSHIAAPSASLHSIGTENRPFAGICRRFFFLMSSVTKTVFGERPSKACLLTSMGILIQFNQFTITVWCKELRPQQML